MLDIHTHILPAVDDGSKSVQQSIEMLLRETEEGIDKVVFTPHFYAERESPDCFVKRRNAAYQMLENELSQKEISIQKYLGAEVAYFSGMSRAEQVDMLCIEGTRALMIEMPFCRWGRNVMEEIFFLREYRGIRPIIAHIERYMRYQPMGMIQRLCESGIWIQTNASFFLNWKTAHLAMHMLKKEQIHFIGSDCHNMEKRAPNMEAALSQIGSRLGSAAMDYLEYMEQELLEDE